MPWALEVTAYAKINLFLNVLGAREDGYHELRTVLQSVSLSDRLLLEPLHEGEGIQFSCSEPDLETDDNLVIRAYHLFFKQLGMDPLPLRASLEKQIPVQAGLGGGSADAAAMLAGLNYMMDDALRLSTLQSLAGQLGSDVPFCLTGGTAIGTGRGEVLTPCLPLESMALVLLTPRGLGVSSATAYGKMRERAKYREIPFDPWETVLRTAASSMPPYPQLLYNDFEWVVFPDHPQLSEAKMALEALALPGVLLSGSGPTLLALMDHPDRQWPEMISQFPEAQWIRHCCRFVSEGLRVEALVPESELLP